MLVHGSAFLIVEHIAVVVAALTTFYMFRLIFIAFLGKAKDEHAEHAKEVPLIMAAPLAILAIMALASPWLGSLIPALNDFHPHTHIEVYRGSPVPKK